MSIVYTTDVEFTAKNDLTLDFLRRVLQIAYTDSVREEKGGTYRYAELNPIIYQQLENIANDGPAASSMQKVKEYLLKQYDQMVITNDYWDYIIWHELEDGVDFDKDYKRLVTETTAADVQQMARRIVDAKRRIEVTMLSE